MEVSQRISVSGLIAHQRQMDVISNNIANVGTTAFKRSHANTSDIGYQAGLTAPVGPGGAEVEIIGVGEGSQVADIRHDFLPGVLQPSDNPLNVALDGQGFFEVTLPNGEVGYTRDGVFGLDGDGRLVNAGGLPVRSVDGGELIVPEDATTVRFDESGQLFATDAAGTGEALVGQLAISQFRNNQGLLAMGQNLWSPTDASGPAVATEAGVPGGPNVIGHALEASNVDIADEMTRMIQAQRGYQLNLSVVKAWDDIARMTNEITR